MFKKNTAVSGFPIGHFIQTADGAAKTTGTPTCKRLLDGTGGTLTNAASYDATAGVWKIDLAAGDMNGDMVGLVFSLADCIPISYAIRTSTSLVSDVETDTADIQARIPAALIGGRMDANVGAISADATAADNLETMLDGTGGATLTLKKLTLNNTDPTGVAIQVNAYNAINVVGTDRGVMIQGGTNQALYMLSDTAATTVYIEGPSTGGKGVSISSPSDGSSLPGASGIYIQTENGHPGILFDFTDRADAVKVVNSDNGAWVLDDKLFAAATDAATAVRSELATELAHLDADVSEAGGLTAQETRDAMKLAPTAGAPAAGSVDAHLDSLIAYGVGTGTGTYSDTVTDGADPLDNVLVQLSTDSAGTNMVYRAYTAADGTFAMYPDPGTYYVWLELAGYEFTQGAEVTVT